MGGFFSYYVQRCFGTSVIEVLSFPAFYPAFQLPSFFASVVESWALIGGHANGNALYLPPDGNGNPRPLAASTTKLCYCLLLKSTYVEPHCVVKFRPVFGPLYWADTWRQVHIMPLDRHVIDINWKIAHGVIYTADHVK